MFRIRSTALRILLGGLIVTYPTLTGTLTYMFTATSYMAAFVLSVAGPYLLCQSKGWKSRILAVVCISLATGIYQAYIAVSATLLVLCLIRLLLDGQMVCKQILLLGIHYVVLLGVSLGLYWLINQLAMQLTGMEAGIYATSAESQHGIAWRIVQAYGAFALSFITGMNSLIPTVFGRCLHLVCMAAVMLRLFAWMRQRKDLVKNLLLLGLVFILPLAMNGMYLIAGSGAIHTLVLCSNVGIYILAAVVLEAELAEGRKNRLQDGLSTVTALGMSLLIVGNIYLANQAYLNLHLRYENNYALCTSLTTQVQMTPGYTRDTPVLLAGRFDEPGFYSRFDAARGVTGVRGVDINSWSNYLFFRYYCGVSLPMPEAEQAEQLLTGAELEAMPVYPENGSVKMIDGVIVVKLS